MVYTVLITLVIVTRRQGRALEGAKRMSAYGGPGGPSRWRAPGERDRACPGPGKKSGERKFFIPSPSRPPPTSSPVSRPGRTKPRRLQLLFAALAALVQTLLHSNCRTSDRVCRRAFKWKLPVAGREGLRCAPCRRPCCTDISTLGHAFGGCHAVRHVRTEAGA